MVEYWEPPVCEICGSEDAKMCPVMTGVGFKEPPEKQRYVCDECIICWHEGGGTTIEELRKSRGLDKYNIDPEIESAVDSAVNNEIAKEKKVKFHQGAAQEAAPLLCDICCAPNVKKRFLRFAFEYRLPSGNTKMLFAEAHVYRCKACGLSYTDGEAEDARTQAVKDYLNNHHRQSDQ